MKLLLNYVNIFRNIVKIRIAKKVNDRTYDPYVIPSSNSITQLVFKSSTTELRVPLYLESNEVDLAQGVVIFKISSADQSQLKKIFQTNKNFYITLTTNGIESSIYDGVFSLLQEEPRVVKNDTTLNQSDVPLAQRGTITRSNLLKSVPSVSSDLVAVAVPQVIKVTNGNILQSITQNTLSTTQLRRLL